MGEARQVVRVRSSATSPDVEIDPGGRLIESSIDGKADPRRDNRNFSRWRFLIESVYANVNSTSGHLDISLITLIKAAQEPKHLFVLFHSAAENFRVEEHVANLPAHVERIHSEGANPIVDRRDLCHVIFRQVEGQGRQDVVLHRAR